MVIQEKNKEALFNEEKKPKKFWVSPIFMEKKLKGELHALIQGLKLLGSEYFFKQFWMTSTKLEELLSWVAQKIDKSRVRR